MFSPKPKRQPLSQTHIQHISRHQVPSRDSDDDFSCATPFVFNDDLELLAWGDFDRLRGGGFDS